MPFEEYMAACLYDPEDGFFATGPLRSTKSGDFLTSPEVSPWFGRCLGRFVKREYQRLDRPTPFHLVDVGAGSGSLLAGILSAEDALGQIHRIADDVSSSGSGGGESPDSPAGPSSGQTDGIEVWAADVSPAARQHLGTTPQINHVIADLAGTPPSFDGTIIANELLDNLPVALAVRSNHGWEERWVGSGEDDEMPFSLVAAPPRPEVEAWADSFAGNVPNGGLVEVEIAATAWLQAALDRIKRGAIVVIDYGGTAEELEPRRTQGTLRTYRAHHLGPDPLAEPGETDVTVDVNFSALLATASQAGAAAELYRQDDFLTNLGLRNELSRIRREELEEARDGDPLRRLTLRSERTDAETLLHPRGLGDFRVLVATKG